MDTLYIFALKDVKIIELRWFLTAISCGGCLGFLIKVIL
jgi:hypothetical protein